MKLLNIDEFVSEGLFSSSPADKAKKIKNAIKDAANSVKSSGKATPEQKNDAGNDWVTASEINGTDDSSLDKLTGIRNRVQRLAASVK